jgi:hypothetical protein
MVFVLSVSPAGIPSLERKQILFQKEKKENIYKYALHII